MNLKKITEYFVYIIPISLIGLGFYGDYHASKKHNKENPHIFLCVYYGFESFWHIYDYSELNDNVRVAIYLLMFDHNSIDPKSQLEFNQSKKEFKAVINKCDQKEFEYIKNGVTTYLEMKNDFEKQCYNAIVNYSPNQTIKIENNKQLLKKLSTFGLEKEINEIYQMEKNLNSEMNEKLRNNLEFSEIVNSQKDIMKNQLEKEIEFRNTLLNELFE
jgi:hypothetical protein